LLGDWPAQKEKPKEQAEDEPAYKSHAEPIK
jgi:hypothetical protein